MNGRQFIYHMQGLTKTYPGNRKVLENINLSFYPDAKIGVLGVNGSGKSTLLRIMAGIDTEFNGEGFIAEGGTRTLKDSRQIFRLMIRPELPHHVVKNEDRLGGGAGIARSGELDNRRVQYGRSPHLCALSDRYHPI